MEIVFLIQNMYCVSTFIHTFFLQGELRNRLNIWWNSLHEGEKMFYGLLVANATVFLAWKMGERMPSLQKFMVKN